MLYVHNTCSMACEVNRFRCYSPTSEVANKLRFKLLDPGIMQAIYSDPNDNCSSLLK